jgi:hypothetical protein
MTYNLSSTNRFRYGIGSGVSRDMLDDGRVFSLKLWILRTFVGRVGKC